MEYMKFNSTQNNKDGGRVREILAEESFNSLLR